MPQGVIPIRLMVFDIDGVLTRGEARPVDLWLLEEVAELNRAARADPTRPEVTVYTGRAAPYVEGMLQAIDGHLPGIFENGAGLYVPDGYRFLRHPEWGHPHPEDTHTLREQATSALGSLRDTVDLVYSRSCLYEHPRGIHKGRGVAFLADHTGYGLGEMLGVGDSDVDLQFLSAVGHSAAPANANQAVKRLVYYAAPRPTGDGVRDILAHFITTTER